MADFKDLGPYSTECLEFFETLELDEVAKQAVIVAPDRKFTPVSGVTMLGVDVPAGIKKREASSKVAGRVANELYFLDKLLKAFPKHSGSAPMFTYAVSIGEDEGGILTEDFTRGGTRSLTEFHDRFGSFVHRQNLPEGLYRDIFDALGGRVYAEAFGHMLGFAFDREVLVDFNDVAYPDDEELGAYKALVEATTVDLTK